MTGMLMALLSQLVEPAMADRAKDCADKLAFIERTKRTISLEAVKNCKTDDGLGLFIHNEALLGDRPEQVQLPTASNVEERLETQARQVNQAMGDLTRAKAWYRENCPMQARSGLGESLRKIIPAR